MQRATGSNVASMLSNHASVAGSASPTPAGAQLGAQSALASDESQAMGGIGGASSKLNAGAADLLGGLSSLV
jgi:hypothetical protein